MLLSRHSLIQLKAVAQFNWIRLELLLQMYRNALTTRHHARRTVYSYERWVRRFLRFHHMGLQLDMASL